jgi:hypothetical protein
MLARASPWQRRRHASRALAVPQGLAVKTHRARIAGIVVLRQRRLARHELVAGAALGEGNLGRGRGAGRAQGEENGRAKTQKTVMVADCVTE